MTRSRCVHVLLHLNTRDYKNIGPGPCIIVRELRYGIYTCSVVDLGEGSIYFYHPQRSCGKVMFLHLSVILFTGADTPMGSYPPPGKTPP